MRICILTISVRGIGGMQQHTLDLARGLASAGHDIVVISAGTPDATLDQRVTWRFLGLVGDQDQPSFLRGSYEAFIDAHGESRFDVVHSESSTGRGLLQRGVQKEVPFVVMYHGAFLGLARAATRRAIRSRRPLEYAREAKKIALLARRHIASQGLTLYRDCEAIVPSQQQVNSTRWSCLLDKKRIHVVPNGVDVSIFRPRSRTAMRAELRLGEGLLFACVGRLSPEKGFHHAIRAVSRLESDARLLIVGGGEMHSTLQLLARELGVQDRVVFAGPQPPERVARYLAAADAFLFPTERDEAAPLVLPQAMAVGLPVVASRIGGIPEVLDPPGTNGILVPPGDVACLTEAMSDLSRDPASRARLGEAGLRRASQEYTNERMVERTLDVYRVAIRRLESA